MIEIKNLDYSVREEGKTIDILKDVNLTLKDRSLTVITGPNGGGKTTLAKAIMGLIQPTSGSIVYEGEDITNLSITERARKGISFGFQQPPRFKGLKISDLLNIAAERELQEDECCKYLNQVGLCTKDYLYREMDNSLSGGEVKRVEIATILARGGDVMIFDEPEAGIDLWSFARLTETFKHIHASTNATMVIISHQERIIKLADEIVVVSNGTVTRKGSVEKIFPTIINDTVASCTCCEEG